jgi:DNA-binding CsgD family transcriptional regulator
MSAGLTEVAGYNAAVARLAVRTARPSLTVREADDRRWRVFRRLASPSDPSHTLSIIIVDSRREARDVVELIRAASGFECVYSCTSLQEAFSWVDEHQAESDLFVTDLRYHGKYYPKRPSATRTFTDQERKLLQLLVQGHYKKTAATAMGISIHTVSFHLKNVYAKLQVHSKTQAVAKALRERLV